MIDTLFFALQIIGIAILIGWALVHDQLREGMPTRGPLAFKPDEGDIGESPRDRKHGSGSTRRRSRSGPEGRRR